MTGKTPKGPPTDLSTNERFTYADYQTWDDSQRWELINGKAYNMYPVEEGRRTIPNNMSPAPGRYHQRISMQILLQLGKQLEGKTCQVYHAPFDVRLPVSNEQDEDIIDVVQPDISIICDPEKLDEKGCLGAPDLIIEILSPATSQYDKIEKFNLYEEAGVKEYWLVSPYGNIVEAFQLGPDNRYGRPSMYSEKDTITSTAVKDIHVDLNTVFEVEKTVKSESVPHSG